MGEICGFQACKHLDCGLTDYQTLFFAKGLTMFQRTILSPSSGCNLQHYGNLASPNELNVYYSRYIMVHKWILTIGLGMYQMWDKWY